MLYADRRLQKPAIIDALKVGFGLNAAELKVIVQERLPLSFYLNRRTLVRRYRELKGPKPNMGDFVVNTMMPASGQIGRCVSVLFT